MLVYLDTCAVQRPYDDRNQLRVRVEADAVLAFLAAVRAGHVSLLMSAVLRLELGNHPLLTRREATRAVLRLATRNVDTTPAVEARARTYGAGGIRALDALHLASAVEGEADVFCTTDDALLKRALTADTRLTRVLSPLHLVALLDP